MAWTKKKKIVVISAVVAVVLIGVVVAVFLAVVVPRKKGVIKGLALGNPFNRVIENGEHQAENARLRATVWPQEVAATEARIKARQAVDETTDATTIDLKPHINAKLTEAPVCWAGNNANNLAELPMGSHIYGGVPFDVSGVIYLTGGWLKDHYHKHFPVRVDNIRIDQRCKRIHILNGASLISFGQAGSAIGKLVVHYDDGKSQDLPIIAGTHVWDMWAPLFTTGVNPLNLKTPPGPEPAWTGSNPYLKKWQPDEAIVLYKATFNNPRPTAKVMSVDYVSAETATVPFMVGLTVE